MDESNVEVKDVWIGFYRTKNSNEPFRVWIRKQEPDPKYGREYRLVVGNNIDGEGGETLPDPHRTVDAARQSAEWVVKNSYHDIIAKGFPPGTWEWRELDPIEDHR